MLATVPCTTARDSAKPSNLHSVYKASARTSADGSPPELSIHCRFFGDSVNASIYHELPAAEGFGRERIIVPEGSDKWQGGIPTRVQIFLTSNKLPCRDDL